MPRVTSWGGFLAFWAALLASGSGRLAPLIDIGPDPNNCKPGPQHPRENATHGTYNPPALS